MSDLATLAAPHATPCTVLSAADPRACTARRAGRGAASLDTGHARLTRLVRRGCFVQLPLPALFALRLAPGAAPDWSAALRLDTPHGALEIEDGARLIQGLTGIHPGLLPATGSAHRAWFDAALAGRLAGTPLAGAGIALDAVGTDMDAALCLRLELRSGSHALVTHARAGIDTWLGLLQQTEWQHERLPLSACVGMRTESRVLLARHTLPAAALRTLAPGDVIVPDSPVFSPAGEGRMRIADRKVHVRYRGPCSLEIIEVEGKLNPEELANEVDADAAEAYQAMAPAADEPMPESMQDDAQGEDLDLLQDATSDEATASAEPPQDAQPVEEAETPAPEAAGAAFQEEPEGDSPKQHSAPQEHAHEDAPPENATYPDPDPNSDTVGNEAAIVAEDRGGEDPAAFAARHARADLDDIPVSLSFELGRVSLPLDEVRTLGPGVVLLLDGGSPASLAIVAGGRTLGRGEVVDVEGRLGVRLTEWGTQC